MTQSTDVGSLVGTWVAAGVAIIALLGVVGPILVWRASRTDRNKAIDLLSDEGADSGGFVTQGIRVTSKIRLFRRFEAPELRASPSLRTPTLLLDDQVPTVSTNSASWVQFGRLLQAYHINFAKTGLLVIQDGQTWLPIHRSWILIVGIMGRFGKRKDSGKIVIRSTSGVASTQAKPGDFVAPSGRSSQGLPRGLRRVPRNYTPDWRMSNPGWTSAAYSTSGTKYKTLHGITGVIHFGTEMPGAAQSEKDTKRLYFTSHTSQEIGEVTKEPMDIGHMFWLAVGCLPAPGSKVFSLDDVHSIAVQEEPQALPPTPSPVSPGVRFSGIQDDDSDWEGGMGNPAMPEWGIISPNTYVVPTSSPTATLSGYYESRAFQFSPINDRAEALTEVAGSINIDDKSERIYSLEEVELTDEILTELKNASDTTYVPLSIPWVRLDPETRTQGWFLKRDDAQLLAQALLAIPMSPHGYLVSANKRSRCRGLLCQAAQSLPQLLARLVYSFQSLGLDGNGADTLLQMMGNMYAKTERLEKTRSFYEVIFKLDEGLSSVLHPDPRVNDAIGVLMITNEEFRALIAQSARHIDESVDTTLEFDVANGTLNVPAVMGFIQRFPVEIAVLYPELRRDDGPITITLRELMFAALKARVRGAVLETSLDSLPLFKAFFDLARVVHLG
ncbi:hypothetical protein BDV96DRAFT_659036 [Lophiotrema nucula]|uniref:Uncharacterized protein n=1 Tax=Lophiotrema nucula TaxID=690887 RepID=A0A6A5ZAN6_9PLEO|nr:hypothetical protein BDV96DRAFT_659036 [Lophiotrema nucula]